MKTETLLAPGNIHHKLLATHYTQTWPLIEDLKESRFSGYLKLEFWEYEGCIIFDTGNIIQAFQMEKGKIKSGIPALSGIYHRFKEKDGTINTFYIDSEFIPFQFARYQTKVIEEVKNRKNDELGEFIKNVSNKIDFGCVNIVYGDGEAWATILLNNGQVVSSALKSKDGKAVFETNEKNLFNNIIKLAGTIKTSAQFLGCDAMESYRHSSKYTEFFSLLKKSETIISVNNFLKDILLPVLKKKEIDEFFKLAWDASCKKNKIEKLHIKSNKIVGLEEINSDQFYSIIKEFLEQLQPEFDKAINGHIAMKDMLSALNKQYTGALKKLLI
jgi:hypothetical protein